ncbi:NAD(P)/FAD-dependent oxidoreductase [uncultured Friedmanniella sp.]|uniref:NAD(P)/FAD-dependent oxidoreductase n=1 Tax=uncultured Friedmanniella sp. TaxID=335381 RepID=UPI0035CB5FA5
MTVIVVGAGISGVAAARTLAGAGVPVVVLDRGRAIGGRMASRRPDGRVVDTGASYFTVSDPAFDEVVQDWRRRGLARPWTDTFSVAGDGELTPKSGPMRWAANGGLRSLVEDLATGLELRQVSVESVEPGVEGAGLVVDGEAAEAVVLAMPDPQARRLLPPELTAELAALTDPFEPVLALTARWAEASWPAFDGAFVSGDPILSWIADDGRRRDDFAPVLVAHSTPEFAAEHLGAPDEAAPLMALAVRDVLGIAAEPTSTAVQRWSFARPAGRREQTYWLGEHRIGFCGDSWSDKPRVEAAYLSGMALGRAVADQLS